MPKEHCPHCDSNASYKDAYIKAGAAACVDEGVRLKRALCVEGQTEKKSQTIISLDELYHVAQSLESQAQRLRNCFGLVIASQPNPSIGGQLGASSIPDCELIGRLEEIGQCLRRTLATHEETLELRRV